MPDRAGGDSGESRSDHGAPASGEAVPDRFSADEVFQRITVAADEEVTSGSRELFFSAVAAGFAISITFLLYASMSAATDGKLAGALLYPLGFIYIIIGGYQLYTENTLPPVALTLERLVSFPRLLRHWSIVLAGNFAGGAVGAIVLTWGGVFEPAAAAEAVSLAEKGAFGTGWWALFYKAVFAGLIVAGVVWVEYAAQDTISRLVVVYLAFLAIPMGDLFHVVVSFTEALYLIFRGGIAAGPAMAGFVLPVLLGNTIGGVVLVTVVNYFQTTERRLESARFAGADRRLSVPEWTLGRIAGRSYVPILDSAEAALLGEDSYRIMVPITNPRTESELVELACLLADEHDRAIVHVVHVVRAPERLSLLSGGHHERIREASGRRMEAIEAATERYDVDIRTSTVATYRAFEEIFDAAKRTRPDMVLMTWGEDKVWDAARADRPIDELTNQLPCDFLVLNRGEVDPSRILLPTAGGPDSELGAEVARALRSAAGSEVALLHVVDDPAERTAGEEFLESWADDHGLGDAALTVDDSGDVEAAIEREAADKTMLIIGATERGMLSRLVAGSLHLEVVNEVDCAVLLAERPGERSLRERLFGSGRRGKAASGR